MTQPSPPPSIPFNPTPTDQRWNVGDGATSDGTKLITLTIVQPMTSTVLALTQESARALADELFTHANGLQVVRDIGPEGRAG